MTVINILYLVQCVCHLKCEMHHLLKLWNLR